MATSIIGIPTTRVSDLFIRRRLLNQVQYDQGELFRLQTQLSTGRRFEAPSEEPVAALRVMSLQRLLERKSQVASNLTTNQSYLSNTDVTVSSVSNNMADVRATALGVVGTLATDEQRRAAAQQVSQSLRSLLETGNQKFRGRYLFSGTHTSERPFAALPDGAIRYDGNEGHVESYADIDLLFPTNLQGTEVFGAMSEPVRGTVDLDARLTLDTRVTDLRAGRGISKGSIRISDGSNVSTIDLSSAETIGDMAALIKANPPPGRELFVEVTNDRLRIRLAGTDGNLSIHEVGGGTVAYELGILQDIGVGLNPITGRDLDPLLGGTTSLDDLAGVGARSWAVLHSVGADNDIRFVADQPGAKAADGTDLNALAISLLDDPAVVAGGELVDYDPVAGTLVVRIEEGASTAADVVAAVNARDDIPFTAAVDRLDDVEGGRGKVMAGAATVTAEGDGEAFDRRGLRIENQNETFDADFHAARTVEDLLNKLNGLGAGLLAELNAERTGINVRSRVSGSDFMIGENGGETAEQLGLRTFTEKTRLEDLNYGQGMHTLEGTDFTITIADGSTLEVDVSGLATIGEVVEKINDLAAAHVPPLSLEARLAEFGNGITLTDTSSGPNTLKVDRSILTDATLAEGSTDIAVGDLRTLDKITLADGTKLDVDTTGLATTSDIVDYLNLLSPGKLQAAPTADGKSVTLTDHTSGPNNFRVQRTLLSTAAVELGLIPPGQHASGSPVTTGVPEVLVESAGVKNNVIIRAKADGSEYNGVTVVFDNAVLPPSVVYDESARTLTFGIQGGRTAQQVVNDLAASPAAAYFEAELDPADGSGNDGFGDVDLIIPPDLPEADGGSLNTYATASVPSGGFDNDLIFTANHLGALYNGTKIQFVDSPGTDPAEVLSYTPGVELVVGFDATASHTANDIIAAVAAHPQAGAHWTVSRDPADESPNDGSEPVDVNAGELMEGGVQTLDGRDTRPLEVESLFTSLLRLQQALEVNDVVGIERAIGMLDRKVVDLNFARAELGARQQGIEMLQYRIDTEDVELQSVLSLEYDADLVEVISSLTGRQAAFEASLRSMGTTMKMSLLNYL